jgi:hypothetical protein
MGFKVLRAFLLGLGHRNVRLGLLDCGLVLESLQLLLALLLEGRHLLLIRATVADGDAAFCAPGNLEVGPALYAVLGATLLGGATTTVMTRLGGARHLLATAKPFPELAEDARLAKNHPEDPTEDRRDDEQRNEGH